MVLVRPGDWLVYGGDIQYGSFRRRKFEEFIKNQNWAVKLSPEKSAAYGVGGIMLVMRFMLCFFHLDMLCAGRRFTKSTSMVLPSIALTR